MAETTTPNEGGVANVNAEATANVTNEQGVEKTPESNVKFDTSKLSAEQIEEILSSHKTKVKINGKEKELSYAEMKKLSSIQEAANEKFEVAKKTQKELDEFKKIIDSGDLVNMYKSQGKSLAEIKELLTNKVLDIMEMEEEDPRDRMLREYEAKEKALKDKEENEKKSAESRKQQEEYEKVRNKMENDLISAFEGSKLPPNDPAFYKMVAQEMLAAEIAGVELSAKEAVKEVEDRVFNSYMNLLQKLPLDKIKQVLGKDFLKALREESVAEVKKDTSPFAKPQVAAKQETSSKNKENKIPMNDFFKQLRSQTYK